MSAEEIEVIAAVESTALADVSAAIQVTASALVLSDLDTANANARDFVDEFQPTAEHLIGLVAAEYGVSHDLAAKWLRDAFGAVFA